MKGKLCTLFAVGIMAATALTATAATKHYPRNIVSQSPSDSPALAQANSEAMFLRSTDYDRSLLYIEANNGSTLDVLDVTDPAKISRVALGRCSPGGGCQATARTPSNRSKPNSVPSQR
jgi:hypothetical protein